MYWKRYMTETKTTLKTAPPSTFFLVNINKRPTTTAINITRETAESRRNKLQYFLPKGPNREFIIHKQKKKF
jgi:predicted ATP-grasp superfamily ATP-dependent carboligase